MEITILTYGLQQSQDNPIRQGFAPPRFRVVQSSNDTDLVDMLRETRAQIIVLGLSGADGDKVLEQVRRIRATHHDLPIVVISRMSSEARATAAFRAGVDDYFKEPISREQLLGRIGDLLLHQSAPGVRPPPQPPLMIGTSETIRATRDYIIRAAATQSTVLITGETGTGKELAARLIHHYSCHAAKPLIAVNCAALPESLAESELFGYERGAFTGALEARKGKFALAEGSTLFLDEIGDMTPYIQAKILHAIEEKVVYPLGCNKPVTLDVRVVAATNRDLEHLVEQQQFRGDLYYRLNIARVHLPPLRDRREDIPDLVQHGICDLNRRFGRRVAGMTDDALGFLHNYPWPGNVRELLNLLESTYISLSGDSAGERIGLDDLPPRFRQQAARRYDSPESEVRQVIVSALTQTNWNKSRAARKLNWSRMTLYRKMSRLKISETRPPDPHKTFSSM